MHKLNHNHGFHTTWAPSIVVHSLHTQEESTNMVMKQENRTPKF